MTKKEYHFYMEADRIMAGRQANSTRRRIRLFFFPDYLELFMLLLRKVEYLNGKKGLINRINSFITKNKFKRISLKLGFSIPPNVFGPGLLIPHYGTVVINSHTKVGSNCVLHTATCIAGSEPKKLGNNIYISTGSVIMGNITIADNTTIAANSVVNKSFLEGNVLIGGSPAKVLKERKVWFECDGAPFTTRAKKIEDLYKSTFKDIYTSS